MLSSICIRPLRGILETVRHKGWLLRTIGQPLQVSEFGEIEKKKKKKDLSVYVHKYGVFSVDQKKTTIILCVCEIKSDLHPDKGP